MVIRWPILCCFVQLDEVNIFYHMIGYQKLIDRKLLRIGLRIFFGHWRLDVFLDHGQILLLDDQSIRQIASLSDTEHHGNNLAMDIPTQHKDREGPEKSGVFREFSTKTPRILTVV
jgi:hypothetical protein